MRPIFQTHRCLSAEELHQYSTGRLSGPARFRVENHLLDCALCADAVEGRAVRPGRDTAPLPSANAFLAGLSDPVARETDVPADTQREATVRPLPRRRPWLQWVAAASVVALAAVSVWYFQETARQDRVIAESYDTPDADIINPRGADAAALVPTKLDAAMDAYDRAAYAESAELFAAVVATDPQNEEALYYGGLSELEAGDTAAAIPLFERTLAIGQKYPEQAIYHLAVAHVQQRELTKARSYLKQLTADESGLYYDRARELLREL